MDCPHNFDHNRGPYYDIGNLNIITMFELVTDYDANCTDYFSANLYVVLTFDKILLCHFFFRNSSNILIWLLIDSLE